MRLSYVIHSRNQRDALLRTISTLPTVTPLRSEHWQVWVVDNASSDGTAQAVKEQFPGVNLITTKSDRDRSALNEAFNRSQGEYLVWLDAATIPHSSRAVKHSLEHLFHRPQTAAVVGKVILPDGTSIGPELPTVLMPGAVCFRRAALQRVGGFDRMYPGTCGDLDLSFRLWQAGYQIQRRDDIIFEHSSEIPAAKTDLADRLMLARKWLPPQYSQDWRQRGEAILRADGGWRKVRGQSWKFRLSRLRHPFTEPTPLSESAMENIFGFRRQSEAIGQWARQHCVWRVVLADFGPNIWATYNACRCSGMQLRCVADNQSAFTKMEYRGLPIVPVAKAFEGGGIDGVIVTNLNPAEIDEREKIIRHYFKGPILKLWQPPKLATTAQVAQAA